VRHCGGVDAAAFVGEKLAEPIPTSRGESHGFAPNEYPRVDELADRRCY
jgi:hypothetical protein